jgi:hypothetical protein
MPHVLSIFKRIWWAGLGASLLLAISTPAASQGQTAAQERQIVATQAQTPKARMAESLPSASSFTHFAERKTHKWCWEDTHPFPRTCIKSPNGSWWVNRTTKISSTEYRFTQWRAGTWSYYIFPSTQECVVYSYWRESRVIWVWVTWDGSHFVFNRRYEKPQKYPPKRGHAPLIGYSTWPDTPA